MNRRTNDLKGLIARLNAHKAKSSAAPVPPKQIETAPALRLTVDTVVAEYKAAQKSPVAWAAFQAKFRTIKTSGARLSELTGFDRSKAAIAARRGR